MKAKNILITGASGLLGRRILKSFNEVKAWKVTGTAHTRPAPELTQVDLADLEHLTDFLDKARPEIIIHSAAERRPDVSQRDPEGTQRLNVGTTAEIAAWAAEHDAFLVYISTDYVFDGTTPPYHVDSLPNPLNSYGESKRAGEVAVLSACEEYAILRVPILYGLAESLGESAVTAIAQSLLDAAGSTAVTVENWAVRHPTLTDDVADVLRQMVLYREEHPTFKGIFHWSGKEAMTKYEMALIFAEHLNFEKSRILPDNRPPAGAPRPKNSQLDTSSLTSIGIAKHTLFREALPRILQGEEAEKI
ncbi:MAG: SDR family oxidoreductase [Kiritimatiellae bacterium]|nr:SDR family oxidoreductase [Kiritimatiellia bacterium]